MLKGKTSEFGGPNDSGMANDEGLSVYEAHEADQRLDLFYHAGLYPNLGVSKRLKPSALYFAYRFPLNPRPARSVLQSTQFLLRNPVNNHFCVAWLADYGPNERTGRVFDVSPGVMAALETQTDSEIEGLDVSELKTIFAS